MCKYMPDTKGYQIQWLKTHCEEPVAAFTSYWCQWKTGGCEFLWTRCHCHFSIQRKTIWNRRLYRPSQRWRSVDHLYLQWNEVYNMPNSQNTIDYLYLHSTYKLDFFMWPTDILHTVLNITCMSGGDFITQDSSPAIQTFTPCTVIRIFITAMLTSQRSTHT